MFWLPAARPDIKKKCNLYDPELLREHENSYPNSMKKIIFHTIKTYLAFKVMK